MKKLTVILAALFLCVMVSAASAEVPPEEEFRELNHNIWAANLFDSVLSRHESYSIRWDHDYISTYQNVYQTKEGSFTEWSSGSVEYIRPDQWGCASYPDPDTGYASPIIFADVGPNVSTHIQTSTETEEESFDFEHDTLTGVEYKDNLIYIYSRYDEEKSRTFMEDWFDAEEPGMIVTTESIVNAENLDGLAFWYRGEKDGETVVLAHITVEYDIPEPSACRILRSILEEESPNMRTCRLYVQSDTDGELFYENTVPVNCPCNVFASGSDYLSDCTFYVFLNPDSELLLRYEELYRQAE